MAAWFPDWEARKKWVERNGLPVIFQEARVAPDVDGFVALWLTADDAVLPRSTATRGFALHISLGYRGDYPRGYAEVMCEFINARWANRFHVLDIEWMGHGGAAMIRSTDPVALDPLIAYLHDNGHYGIVDTRPLHVSL